MRDGVSGALPLWRLSSASNASENAKAGSGACTGSRQDPASRREQLSPRASADLGEGFTSLGTFRFPVLVPHPRISTYSFDFVRHSGRLRNVDWGRRLSVVIAITVNDVPFLVVPSPR
jgi:hypothetical protein